MNVQGPRSSLLLTLPHLTAGAEGLCPSNPIFPTEVVFQRLRWWLNIAILKSDKSHTN